MIPFPDRAFAGRLLSKHLTFHKNTHTVVLGLAKGGVVVADSIARELSLPLDLLVVKKIPTPHNSELAIGAVAPDGIFVVDKSMVQKLHIDPEYVEKMKIESGTFIEEKIRLYRKSNQPLSIKGSAIILADDGIATGATFRVAMEWCRTNGAQKIIGAVPVAPSDVADRIASTIDEFVILEKSKEFQAVGQFYTDFPQLTDNDVIRLLHESHQRS